MVSSGRMLNLGTLGIIILVVLIFAESQSFTAGEQVSKLGHLDSPCNITSCNGTLEDKRGVPTGANPLHNSEERRRLLVCRGSFYSCLVESWGCADVSLHMSPLIQQEQRKKFSNIVLEFVPKGGRVNTLSLKTMAVMVYSVTDDILFHPNM